MSANNSGIVLTCSAAFAAAAPVATVISGTMQTSPTVTAVTELTSSSHRKLDCNRYVYPSSCRSWNTYRN